MNQIVEESDAPKGSLYHYFPDGKDELVMEALRTSGEFLIQRLTRVAEEDPRRALDQLVELSIKDLEQSDYRDGCPIATVALEAAATSVPLGQLCAVMFERALSTVTDWLIRQGATREKAETMAVMAFSAYEGALMLSKVRKNPEPLRKVAEQIKVYMKTAFKEK